MVDVSEIIFAPADADLQDDQLAVAEDFEFDLAADFGPFNQVDQMAVVLDLKAVEAENDVVDL
jgi:hypothetical protein